MRVCLYLQVFQQVSQSLQRCSFTASEFFADVLVIFLEFGVRLIRLLKELGEQNKNTHTQSLILIFRIILTFRLNILLNLLGFNLLLSLSSISSYFFTSCVLSFLLEPLLSFHHFYLINSLF